MHTAYLSRLFDYNYWAHNRVWECVLKLNDEQLKRPCDYSIGSVHEQLVHTMGAEWLWLGRVTNAPIDHFPSAEEYPTLETIRSKWDEIEQGWRAYVVGLTDEDFNKPVEYVSLTGNQARVNTRLDALMQILNHSTDHRAQILSLIHQVGGETIAQDLIFYTWEYP